MSQEPGRSAVLDELRTAFGAAGTIKLAAELSSIRKFAVSCHAVWVAISSIT